MKCTTHSEIDAAGTCSYSGKPYCASCLVEVEGRFVGKDNIGAFMRAQTGQKGAHSATNQSVVGRLFTLAASVAAAFSGAATAGMSFVGTFGMNLFNLVDACFFLVLAYGIYKYSRMCALILFIYHLANRVWIYQQIGDVGQILGIVPIGAAVIYFLGILGAFGSVQAEKPRFLARRVTWYEAVAGITFSLFMVLTVSRIWAGVVPGTPDSALRTQIGETVKMSMQQKFDSDAQFKKWPLTVTKVQVVKQSGNHYQGIATVIYEGESHDVSVDITADSSGMRWQAGPGEFMFIAQKELQKEFAPPDSGIYKTTEPRNGIYKLDLERTRSTEEFRSSAKFGAVPETGKIYDYLGKLKMWHQDQSDWITFFPTAFDGEFRAQRACSFEINDSEKDACLKRETAKPVEPTLECKIQNGGSHHLLDCQTQADFFDKIRSEMILGKVNSETSFGQTVGEVYFQDQYVVILPYPTFDENFANFANVPVYYKYEGESREGQPAEAAQANTASSSALLPKLAGPVPTDQRTGYLVLDVNSSVANVKNVVSALPGRTFILTGGREVEFRIRDVRLVTKGEPSQTNGDLREIQIFNAETVRAYVAIFCDAPLHDALRKHVKGLDRFVADTVPLSRHLSQKYCHRRYRSMTSVPI